MIDITEKTNKNDIIACIYRHPCLSTKEFNEDFLQTFLEKHSYENKNVILLGDFNIDLVH